ncbi:MAG: hypothetical protein MJ157_05665, partial [Clostridia bacterium]|nr:hypothetical protein [Clostridia bacterium]
AQNIKSRNYPESVLKYYQTCYQAKSLPDDWLFYDGSDSTILNLRWKLTKGTGFNLAVDDYFSNAGGYRLDDWGGIMNLLRSKKIISEIVMIFLDGMQILITYKLTVEGRLWVHELKKEYGCPVPKFFLDTQPGNAKKMLAKIAPIRQARSDKQRKYVRNRKKAGR